MERKTRVSVFESSIQQEIQLVKSKLNEAGIESTVENAYLTFTTTPTANMLSVKVNLNKERDAFEIIDKWLQESKNSQN